VKQFRPGASFVDIVTAAPAATDDTASTASADVDLLSFLAVAQAITRDPSEATPKPSRAGALRSCIANHALCRRNAPLAPGSRRRPLQSSRLRGGRASIHGRDAAVVNVPCVLCPEVLWGGYFGAPSSASGSRCGCGFVDAVIEWVPRLIHQSRPECVRRLGVVRQALRRVGRSTSTRRWPLAAGPFESSALSMPVPLAM
jgi:hypothetical protein